MRTFKLHRKIDDSGVSGTGIVAEGAEMHDGQCVLSWFSKVHAVAIYPTIDDLISIHGHGGHTVAVFDPSEQEIFQRGFQRGLLEARPKDHGEQ